MLQRLISVRVAGHILLVMLGALVIFHILILAGVLPASLVWGGEAQFDSQKISLEVLALIVTGLMIWLVLAKLNYVEAKKLKPKLKMGLWVVAIYLLLNALGNIASSSDQESMIFTPIALLLALLFIRLAVD